MTGAAVPRPPHMAVMLDLAGRRAVVTGGGVVAERRAAQLCEAGADVVVVAPTVTPALHDGATGGTLHWERRAALPADVEGAAFVVCATDDREANRAVAAAAATAGIPVNVVDDPSLCTAIMPSTLRRGALQVAVSTGGLSPTVAVFTRRLVESLLPAEMADLLDLAAAARTRLREDGAGPEERDRLLGAVLPELLALLLEGRHDEARRRAGSLAGGEAGAAA